MSCASYGLHLAMLLRQPCTFSTAFVITSHPCESLDIKRPDTVHVLPFVRPSFLPKLCHDLRL